MGYLQLVNHGNMLVSWYHKFLHVYSVSYTGKIMDESLVLLGKLWPYMVLGILISTLIKMYVSKQWLTAVFSKNKGLSIFIAAFIGVFSPLGSYVIIPLCAALFTIGLPLPVLMALLMSSPLINPNLFFLTSGAFGLELALVRTFSSFLLGVSAGYLTKYLISVDWIKQDEIVKTSSENRMQHFNENNKKGYALFMFELYRMTRYVSRFFFIAILLAAAVKILIPPRMVMAVFGTNMFLSVLFSTGAGIPFYVCGGASIPVIQQLAELGMSKGAVLAFFISGPATKISNLVIMNAAFRKKVSAIYVLVGIVGAFVLGVLYNFL